VLATAPRELAKVDDRLNQLLAGDEHWANLGFHQVAGASAGGMNAMAFAIEVCRNTLLPTFAPETADPSFLDKTDSVLRRVWMDVGFEKSSPSSWAGGTTLLRDKDLPAGAPHAERNAVFSADPLNTVISAVEQFFQATPPVALRANCGMGVSITVTSLNPVEVFLRGGQSGSFLSVTIPVMVDLKMSQTMPPHFEVHAHQPADPSVMTVSGKDARAFLALVRATGALPPALPMVSLCQNPAGTILFGAKGYAVEECHEDKKNKCPEGIEDNKHPECAKDRALNLIDGGLFNNNRYSIWCWIEYRRARSRSSCSLTRTSQTFRARRPEPNTGATPCTRISSGSARRLWTLLAISRWRPRCAVSTPPQPLRGRRSRRSSPLAVRAQR
jgi:hypothetical protein